MFFRMLAYRREARSNQSARKVRQTPLSVLDSVSEIEQLPIEETVKDKWLYGNAARFLRIA